MYFTKRQILCSTGKGQALTVKVESVPELDSCRAWCNNEKRAQKQECINMINVGMLYKDVNMS